MNPFTYQKTFVATGGSSSVRVTRKNAAGDVITDYADRVDGPGEMTTGVTNVDPLSEDDVDAKARTRVLLEAKDQKVNMMQVFAERHQTVNLFETTVKRVVNTVRYLRHANWNGAANELGLKPSRGQHAAFAKRHRKNPKQAIAQGWLELQYGWRPLLQDVYGAIDLVQAKTARKITSRVQKSASAEDAPSRPDISNGLITYSFAQKRKTSVKYVLYYSTPNEIQKTLGEVGITNPGLVAWELLPWSFVVDWLLPVGNFISSWDAVAGLSFEKGVRTVFQEVSQKVTTVGGTLYENGGRDTIAGSTSLWQDCHIVIIHRTPLAGFPSVSLPAFKNPFSAEHLANLSALVLTAFNRR
jgi:hypothetical protein